MVIFPIISLVLSVFSFLIINAEGVRMGAIRKRMNTLLIYLSESYKELDIDSFEKIHY